MAVREAFIIFLASPWAHSYKLIIESDSKDVIREWKIAHIFREISHVADSLAKEGINRREDLLLATNS
ncbi:hypothetical protein DITRI_Ditri06bG0148500 [Diplodiscus trichospermus]